MDRELISVLIPCYNEERGVAKVIENFPRERLRKNGYELEIIVIDNNSTDDTAAVARKLGAIVISEPRKGKGYAVKTGFANISREAKYVVMLDGDNTYNPKEIIRMLEPLFSNFCDVIVGSRLGGKIRYGSLRFSNRVVNWGYTFLVRQFYQANVTDVISGYFAWKRSAVTRLLPHLQSTGFAIEMEMITKMHKLGFEVYSVPITYDKREGESKISAFSDGVIILSTFFRYLFWKPKK